MAGTGRNEREDEQAGSALSKAVVGSQHIVVTVARACCTRGEGERGHRLCWGVGEVFPPHNTNKYSKDVDK